MRDRAVLMIACMAVAFGFCAKNAAAQIQVTSAVPSSSAQGTINLDVTVNGNGFKRGAVAQWFVSGTTNPGGVTVNSTTFSNSNQLTANITVATDAVVGSFDIVVKNADGRTGKGTELFSVLQKTNQTAAACPTPVAINPGTNLCTSSTQQSGCLDATFGSEGFVSTNATGVTTNHDDWISVVRQQPDGKLVAIGRSGGLNLAFSVAIARYNLDGSLDPGFGNDGIVTYAFSNVTESRTYDGVLDSAGNILVTGENSAGAFSMRFTPGGALDSSFGSGGIVSTGGRAIALQPDGKILIAGSGSTSRKVSGAAVFRLNTNGSLDMTFGSGGVAVLTTAWVFSDITVELVNNLPYILVAGSFNDLQSVNNSDFGIARFTPSGAVDTLFGQSGQVSSTLCGYGGEADSITLDPVSGIYAAGIVSVDGTSTYKVALVKYTNLGQIDSSFGDKANTGKGLAGGTVIDYYGGLNFYQVASQLATQTDAGLTRVLVGGYGPNHFNLARITPTGALDLTFGGTGAVAVTFPGGLTSGYGAYIESDGRILAVGGGAAASSTNQDFGLVRFWP